MSEKINLLQFIEFNKSRTRVNWVATKANITSYLRKNMQQPFTAGDVMGAMSTEKRWMKLLRGYARASAKRGFPISAHDSSAFACREVSNEQ